jgi:hypothetical protein
MSRPYDPESYFNRLALIDMYPRRDDPLRPSPAPGAPAPGQATVSDVSRLVSGFITPPGQRPVVYQRGVNFSFAVGTAPAALSAGRFDADSVVIDVPSTAANSVFAGFGNGINLTSGLEFRPGLPMEYGTDNTREQWELQHALEALVAIMAFDRGIPLPSLYRAPRVCYNLADIYVVASAATTISVTAFFIPEQQ